VSLAYAAPSARRIPFFDKFPRAGRHHRHVADGFQAVRKVCFVCRIWVEKCM